MAMKGKHPADEIGRIATAVQVFHVEHLRCRVWMRSVVCVDDRLVVDVNPLTVI